MSVKKHKLAVLPIIAKNQQGSQSANIHVLLEF